MKLYLSVLALFVLAACTSPSSGRKESWDTRVTGAEVAAHCMNTLAEKTTVTAKNWKSQFKKKCGKDASRYLGTPQFQEKLTLRAHDLTTAPALAE
jgi:hypothetical protein